MELQSAVQPISHTQVLGIQQVNICDESSVQLLQEAIETVKKIVSLFLHISFAELKLE
jgi:hypothetical protein